MKWSFACCLAAAITMGTAAQAGQEAAAPAAAPPDALAAAEARLAPMMRDANDPLLRQELRQILYSGFSVGYLALLQADPGHPDFFPVFNQAYNFFAPNPDDTYYASPLEPAGTYRISGFRGTTRIVDFQIAGGDLLPYGTGTLGKTFANHDLDKDVRLGKDGAFSVVVSAKRPDGYDGDWWALDPGATYVVVRQVANDWANEVDGRYAIERLDVPAVRSRLDAKALSKQLDGVAVYAENWTAFSLKWIARLREQGVVNRVIVHDLTKYGGLSTQHYIEGLFELQPDEALIYETEIPKQCRYWNLELTDELWRAVDYLHRHSTLNGHTAQLDPDGKFRAVIAAQDPGVPNWIDTAGYARGSIFGRWTECSSYPQPVVKKVKFADVKRGLPATTPTISPEQRDQVLRERRRAWQLRRRW